MADKNIFLKTGSYIVLRKPEGRSMLRTMVQYYSECTESQDCLGLIKGHCVLIPLLKSAYLCTYKKDSKPDYQPD